VSAVLTVLTVVVYLTDSELAETREKGRELTDRDVSLSVGICCELLGVRRLVGICSVSCCATVVVALLCDRDRLLVLISLLVLPFVVVLPFSLFSL